jgi:uncharacterized protein
MKWVRRLAVLLICTVFALCFQAWWLTSFIISPPRSLIDPIEEERLNRPERFGLKISKQLEPTKRINYIVIEPTASSPLYLLDTQNQFYKKHPDLPVPSEISLGNLFLIHGHSTRKENLLPLAEVLSSLGIRCILFDLDAHGESNVQLLKYKNLNPTNAELILAHTQLNHSLSSKQNSILGISTGALFATQTFIQSDSWNSLCLLSMIPTPLYYLQYNIQQAPLTFSHSALKYISTQMISTTIGSIPSQFELTSTLPKISKPLWIAHGLDDDIYPMAKLKNDFPFFNSTNNSQLHPLSQTDHYNSYADVQNLSLLLAEWLYQHHWIKNQPSNLIQQKTTP